MWAGSISAKAGPRPQLKALAPQMLLTKKLLTHYRPNVGIMLFQRDGRVWLGRRTFGFDALNPESFLDGYRWQMPQGGIDKGEDFTAAALRELHEETGVRSATLLMITPGWLAYDFPPEYKRGNWRGQRQKWALMMFTGEDAQINIAADDDPEFDDWRWAALEEVAELIVPFKRAVYEELVAAALPLRDYIAR